MTDEVAVFLGLAGYTLLFAGVVMAAAFLL
jgi:hypothetical protein